MSTFWVIVVVVMVLLVITASQHRRHAGETDQRLCRSCGTSHPAFARFCRRCGRALGE
jgi:ribosomal protein L40E